MDQCLYVSVVICSRLCNRSMLVSLQFLKVLSALAAVIVSILFLHLLLSYLYRKVKERKAYRSALPPVMFRHPSSTAEEEEVLLLETLRDKDVGDNEMSWNKDNTDIPDHSEHTNL